MSSVALSLMTQVLCVCMMFPLTIRGIEYLSLISPELIPIIAFDLFSLPVEPSPGPSRYPEVRWLELVIAQPRVQARPLKIL